MVGQTAHRILFALVQFIAPKFGISEGRKFYDANRQLEPMLIQGPITDQSRLGQMKYGDTDVEKSGCEAIAIYNVLLLKRRPKPLSDIIHDLQVSQTLVNRGHWGTNPFNMDKLLTEYGLHHECMETTDEAEEKMGPGELLLVTVWNHGRRPLRGIHGYVIQMRDENDYLIYNKNYKAFPDRAKTLKEAIGEGSYIVGYLIR